MARPRGGESDLQKILTEAAEICALSLGMPYAKICRYRADRNDLLVEAGHGWSEGVVWYVVSPADEVRRTVEHTSPAKPVILEDLSKNDSYALPPFYADHKIVATADVLIKGKSGPWGVLEIDSATARAFDQHDIDFLTGFGKCQVAAVSNRPGLQSPSRKCALMRPGSATRFGHSLGNLVCCSLAPCC